MSTLPFDGIAVSLGGRDFTVPPLCLRDVKRFIPVMADLFGKPPMDQMMVTSEVILAALQRNYPDLTMEELDVLLDPKSIQSVMAAIMEASGLKKSPVTPAESPAESPSTGTDSTPPSSSAPDGPGNTSTTT